MKNSRSVRWTRFIYGNKIPRHRIIKERRTRSNQALIKGESGRKGRRKASNQPTMIAWHAHCTHKNTRKSNRLSKIYRVFCSFDSSSCIFKCIELVYTIQMKLDQLLDGVVRSENIARSTPTRNNAIDLCPCISLHLVCNVSLHHLPLTLKRVLISFVAICHIATEVKYNIQWIFMHWTANDFQFLFFSQFLRISRRLSHSVHYEPISSSIIIAVDAFIDYVYTERFVNLGNDRKKECNDSKHEGSAECIFHS